MPTIMERINRSRRRSHLFGVLLLLLGLAATIGGWWMPPRLIKMGFGMGPPGGIWRHILDPENWVYGLVMVSGPCITLSGWFLLNENSRLALRFGVVGIATGLIGFGVFGWWLWNELEPREWLIRLLASDALGSRP